MSYKINTTDGTLLVDLVDGRIDSNTTDLTLIGRNYTGYGEFFNENFVRLLENFKNTAPPPSPLIGQLWFDTSEGRLRVYNGEEWKSTDTTIVSATQPTLLAGDVWISTAQKQIYFSDGADVILAGPIYTADQGKSGWDVITLIDRFGVNKTVTQLMIGGISVAIFSKETFTAASISENLSLLEGFPVSIKTGINVNSNYSDFSFYGPADFTYRLLDSSNNSYTPDNFIKVTGNNTLTGTFHIKNDSGITVGDDSDFIIRVQGTNTILRNQLNNNNLALQVTRGGALQDAITIKTFDGKIGFWQPDPQYDLDLNGDVRISGNLIVDGDTISLNVSNLRVEDKLIELALTADGMLLSDAQVDGAGISVRAINNDKTITWNNTYNSWNHSCNVNIPAGFAFKIANLDVLSTTSLGATVSSAVGLTQIGTLINLDVDSINLNGSTITTTNSLIISAGGDINIANNRKITGVKSPVDSDTADVVATKGYVDNVQQLQNEHLALDITGLSNAQISAVINDVIPSLSKDIGITCKVHCTIYTGTYAYNANNGLTKNFIAVDKDGVENQSVVQNFSFVAQTAQPVTLTVIRSLKQFVINGAGNWEFDADLVSSV